MAIRTISEEEVAPGVILVILEITEPGQDRSIVYEVSCEHCDSLAQGLSYAEANAEVAAHAH